MITDEVKIHAETDPNSPRPAKAGANQQLPRIRIQNIQLNKDVSDDRLNMQANNVQIKKKA